MPQVRLQVVLVLMRPVRGGQGHPPRGTCPQELLFVPDLLQEKAAGELGGTQIASHLFLAPLTFSPALKASWGL